MQVSNAIGAIGVTPGDGNMALAALLKKNAGTRGGIAYTGFCHTEDHVDRLRAYWTKRVLKFMQDEGSELYQTQCVPALTGKKPPKRGPPAGQTARPKKLAKVAGAAGAAAAKAGDAPRPHVDGDNEDVPNNPPPSPG